MPWILVQRDVLYAAGVRNVSFRELALAAPRTGIAMRADNNSYSRSVYPGAAQPVQGPLSVAGLRGAPPPSVLLQTPHVGVLVGSSVASSACSQVSSCRDEWTMGSSTASAAREPRGPRGTRKSQRLAAVLQPDTPLLSVGAETSMAALKVGGATLVESGGAAKDAAASPREREWKALAAVPGGVQWLLLLGDSLLRHVFLEMRAVLCGGGSEDHSRPDSTYHNSRTFCLPHSAHDLGREAFDGASPTSRAPPACTYSVSSTRTVHADENASQAWGPRCPAHVLSHGDAHHFCVSFDWAPRWREVLAGLDLVAASCGEGPRALIVNPGLHELAEDPGSVFRQLASSELHGLETTPRLVDGVRRVPTDSERVRREVEISLQEISASLSRARALAPPRVGGRALATLVVQSTTVVQHEAIPRRKKDERRFLTNPAIRAYNAAVGAAIRDASRSVAPLGVCVTATDGFALSTRVGALHNGTIDGIHWRQPFDTMMATADLAHLECQLKPS